MYKEFYFIDDPKIRRTYLFLRHSQRFILLPNQSKSDLYLKKYIVCHQTHLIRMPTCRYLSSTLRKHFANCRPIIVTLRYYIAQRPRHVPTQNAILLFYLPNIPSKVVNLFLCANTTTLTPKKSSQFRL